MSKRRHRDGVFLFLEAEPSRVIRRISVEVGEVGVGNGSMKISYGKDGRPNGYILLSRQMASGNYARTRWG